MTRPDVSFVLLEGGSALGGNHTWSFHGTDITKAQMEWLWVLCSKSWPSHDVIFSGEPRRIGGGYHSIRSEDFHWKLMERLQERVRLRTQVTEVTATRVTLASGEVLEARAVIDGRGFAPTPQWRVGFQKFLGMEVELETPHTLEVPLLMDGRVEQLDGFRFLYVLPFDDRRILVEDTRYADDPSLDVPALRTAIFTYLRGLGLPVKRVIREEGGALPILLGGKPPTIDRPIIGAAAGLFHATTGYSLPMAVDVAEGISALATLDAPTITRFIDTYAARHWSSMGFFRMLNRMLFKGAPPAERLKIFESFYRHDDALIARFYAGTLTIGDKLKVLARGAPTVPTMPAVRAALGFP